MHSLTANASELCY